jgi:hypothetical protein
VDGARVHQRREIKARSSITFRLFRLGVAVIGLLLPDADRIASTFRSFDPFENESTIFLLQLVREDRSDFECREQETDHQACKDALAIVPGPGLKRISYLHTAAHGRE